VCVSVLNAEKEVLKSENAKLSDKCASLEEEVDTLKAANLHLDSHVFSFSQIEHQDKLVKYYTGFSTGLICLWHASIPKSPRLKSCVLGRGAPQPQKFGSSMAASVGPSLSSV